MQKLVKIQKKEEALQISPVLTSAMLKKSMPPNLLPDKLIEKKVKSDEMKQKLEKELFAKDRKISELENGFEKLNKEIRLFFFDICDKIELDPVIFHKNKKKIENFYENLYLFPNFI